MLKNSNKISAADLIRAYLTEFNDEFLLKYDEVKKKVKFVFMEKSEKYKVIDIYDYNTFLKYKNDKNEIENIIKCVFITLPNLNKNLLIFLFDHMIGFVKNII
jgi:hypothetical protein